MLVYQASIGGKSVYMNLIAFESLLAVAVARAIDAGCETGGQARPSTILFEIRGGGVPLRVVKDLAAAARILYLDEDHFWRVIDVALSNISNDVGHVMLAISVHPPVEFDLTWNTPRGMGPFKVLTPNGTS